MASTQLFQQYICGVIMFEDSEFNQATEELNCPKLEDWEFFVETSPDGVHCKIYRQYDQVCIYMYTDVIQDQYLPTGFNAFQCMC